MLSQVQHLYRANRFLDAYSLVRDAWRGPQWPQAAGADELVWGGRIAGRLGGNKLRQFLLRTAMARFPEHPAVLLESRWAYHRRRPVLRILQESLARPNLDSGQTDLDSQWLIDAAFFWAVVRDFGRAHRLLDQASAEHSAVDSWSHSVRSHVLMCEDRWDEALNSARLAWQASPNKPAAGGYLVRMLLRMNHMDEAEQSLSVAAQGQSYETLQLLAWVLCAKAERSSRDARMAIAAQAAQLCNRLEDLAPLRDRYTDQGFAACRFDIAMLAEDAERMQVQADKLTPPVYREISRNLRSTSNGVRVLLDYNPVFQKQDRCLPTSIASIAGTFGYALDADALAASLTYNGTPIWRAVSWLRDHGYAAKVFTLTKDLCRALLVQGLPFVYTFSTSLDSSHATAAVGMDEAAGVLLYHDPANERFGRILIEHLGNCEQPLGPTALAFVPQEQQSRLDCIAEADAQMGELCQKFWHAMTNRDTALLGEVVAAMEKIAPDSPVTQAFRAHRLQLTDHLAEGIAALEKLCARYPKCIDLQRMLLHGLNRTCNTARVREFLGQIVRAGRIPGVSDTLPWSYPPPSCVTRYADLEGLAADRAGLSLELLMQLLRRDPSYAMAYHTLGDIHMRQGRRDEASLPFHLASLLAHTDEHFARSAFDSARLLGHQDEGLAFLRERVDRLGNLVGGGSPWATLIGAMEDCGDVEEAIATARKAFMQRPDDPQLLAFLTRFWIRLGQWEIARGFLGQLEKSSSRTHYLEAAVNFHHGAGQWQQALELCKEWAKSSIDQIAPYQWLAMLMRNGQTIFEVARAARQWTGQRPDDEEFENLYYDQLRTACQDEQQEEFVRARLKRNQQDAWAWRELGHLLLSRAECLDPAKREPIYQEIRQAVQHAVRLSPHEASTVFLQARLAEAEGQWPQAIEQILSALRIEPESPIAYHRAWEDCANLPRAAQEEVLAKLEERLLLGVGQLHQARQLALGVASRLGSEFARARVEQWMAKRPGDPELIEAHADVLLEFGQGRTDAALAAKELEEALKRYPQHYELRLSLSNAYGKMLQDDRRRDMLREAIKARPLDSRARMSLVIDLSGQGQRDEAKKLLQEGIDLNPQDSTCWSRLAWEHREAGDMPSAVAVLNKAAALLPEDVGLRRQLVRYLLESHQSPQAMEVVRHGLKLYPKSPVFWTMLADAMINGPTAYDTKEAMSALGTALDLNHTYYEAADLLAWLLASQYRFDEARKVINDILPKLPNAGAALGRLAWITWVSGQKRPAVDEMAKALENYPNYMWGWWTLMNWLEDLQMPHVTCQLLEQVPPAVRVDPDITARRLDLLHKSNHAKDKLDALWKQTLEDFPRNEDLRIRHFDMLADRGEWKQAKAALEQAESFCASSPYFIYRKLRLSAHQLETRLAVNLAMQVFAQKQSSALCIAAWECLANAKMVIPAVQAVLDAVTAGQELHASCLGWMVQHSARIGKVQVEGKLRDHVWMLRWLAGWMLHCHWDSEHMILGALIEELSIADRPFVRNFLRKNKRLCQGHTRLWQAIGHHLVTGPKPRQAREWTADWRERKGVEMIAVSYYLLSFGRRPTSYFGGWAGATKQWQAMYEAARDALSRLPEDKTLLYMVAEMCESLLALDRPREFVETVGRYRNLLETADGNYWRPAHYSQESTIPRLRMLADLYQCQDAKQAARLFAAISARPRHPVVYVRAYKHAGKLLGFWKRLALSLGMFVPPAK